MRKLLSILFLLPLLSSAQINVANNTATIGGTVGITITESSYIDIKFYRKDAAGLPATVWLLGFDVHIPIISFGSPDEYPTH